MSDRVSYYADAMLSVARGEGNIGGISNEMFTVARAVESNDDLRSTLVDQRIPADRRQQIVEDLLDNKASAATVGLVSMVVGAGRAGELGKMADAFAAKAAAEQSLQVATVRTAVPMTADQQTRLAAALKKSTGKDVDLKVIVDPSVVGGVVTTIGDTVIDGSVRSRLSKLRETL